MKPKYDLTGQKFERLTVLERAPAAGDAGVFWQCRCDCGALKTVQGRSLRTGTTKSCGCWRHDMQNEMRARRARNSVKLRDGKTSPTYYSWVNMKTRCLNSANVNFATYGGRGIGICERWVASYADFLADMGEKPPGTSIDRIDVNGNYEPGNCRWATVNEQARNTRAVRLTEEVRSVIVARRREGALQREVAAELGINQATVSDFECQRTWRPDGQPLPTPKRAAYRAKRA